jgi:putative ABC transport system permease protein
MRGFIINRITSFGTNLLVVRPGDRGYGGVNTGTQLNLTPENAMALRPINGVDFVAPVVQSRAQVKHLADNTNTTIVGTTVTYFPIRNIELDKGRFFTDNEASALGRVAVIGSSAATKLFGTDDPLNQDIKIKGINFRVIGVNKTKGDQGFFSPDEQVYVPYSTAMKVLFGLDHLNEIDVQASGPEVMTQLQKDMTEVMRKQHKLQPGAPDDFSIRNQAEFLDTMKTVTMGISIFLGVVGGIALIVGGIGIMNIMLVTVTERTREIGVRKAIGARKFDILMQFLIETVIMTGLGGFIGISAGVATSSMAGFIIRKIPNMGALIPSVQLYSIVLALGCVGIVGVVSGFYPAFRAAQLDPIEALRYE